MVKVSVNRYVSNRIDKAETSLRKGAAEIRKGLMRNLEEAFQTAEKIVKGEIKHQRVNGNMAPVTLKHKRKWLVLASKIAETVQEASSNINETRLLAKLEELEKLLNELNLENHPYPTHCKANSEI